MLPARFCRINNTRYLIQIQQTNKYWLYRNANPYIFVTKRKKTMSRGWVKDIAHFHEIIWAKKMYIRTQKGLKLLLTTNAYRSSTFRKKKVKFENIHLGFLRFHFFLFWKKIYSDVPLTRGVPKIQTLSTLVKFLKGYEGW